MNSNSPVEIGNDGAFDDFNDFPLLTESQKKEIDEFRNDYATRFNTRRMNSPDSEIREIMGTMEREETPVSERKGTSVPERSRSALSRAMETPEAQKITEQQRKLKALRQESEEEFRSASSNSSGSSRSSSRPIKPMNCVWCGGNIFSYYKDMPIHPSCYATYKIFFDHYNGEWNQKYNRDLTLKEAKKGYEKLQKREKEKLQEKQQRIEDKAIMMKLVEQGKGDMVRDMLFPPQNPQFSGIPDSPEIPDSPDIYQNIDVQTGDNSELLSDSDNEESNDAQSNVVEVRKGDPKRYSAEKSEIARQITESEALEARRKKHKEMIAKKKTKCKKKKRGRCVISGGKKRRKTKKRKKKKRKTRRKRKSKKSKKRRRTRRK